MSLHEGCSRVETPRGSERRPGAQNGGTDRNSQTTFNGDTLPFPGSLSLPLNGQALESLVQSAVTQSKTGGGSGIAGPTSVPPPVSC